MKISMTQTPNGLSHIIFASEENDPYHRAFTALDITIGTIEVIQDILNGINTCAEKKRVHGDAIRTDALQGLITVLEARLDTLQPFFGISDQNELRRCIETVRAELKNTVSDAVPTT